MVGIIAFKFSPEVKGHGIPSVMDAVANKGGYIRKRVTFLTSINSGLTIGSGGSAGKEGPIVQIGDTESEEKPKFAGLRKGQSVDTITLEEALKLWTFLITSTHPINILIYNLPSSLHAKTSTWYKLSHRVLLILLS